jgi:hypothetical protein
VCYGLLYQELALEKGECCVMNDRLATCSFLVAAVSVKPLDDLLCLSIMAFEQPSVLVEG